MPLDEIDRATQAKAPVHDGRLSEAVRIALGIFGQPERKLESPRLPAAGLRADRLEPAQQVSLQRSHLVVPHARHGWREVIAITIGDVGNRAGQRVPHRGGRRNRQAAFRRQAAEELRLNRMEEAPSGERVHALQRLGLFGRREPIDGRQQKAVGTRGVVLQGRERVRTARQPSLVQQRPRDVGGADDAVAGGPLNLRAAPAVDDREPQERVQFQPVVRVPRRGLAVLPEQPCQGRGSCSRSSMARADREARATPARAGCGSRRPRELLDSEACSLRA